MERTKTLERLLGAAVGLARTADRIPADGETMGLIREALVMMFAPESSGENGRLEGAEDPVSALEARIHEQKARLLPDCTVCKNPCGRFFDYEAGELWTGPLEIRDGKIGILERLKCLTDRGEIGENRDLVCRALFALGEDCSGEWLQMIAEELENVIYCPGRQ